MFSTLFFLHILNKIQDFEIHFELNFKYENFVRIFFEEENLKLKKFC